MCSRTMHTIGLLFTWCSFSYSALGQEFDLVSMATGVQGLRFVAQNPQLQKQFALSNDQVSQLNTILHNDSVQSEYVKAYQLSVKSDTTNLKQGVRSTQGGRRAIRIWDNFVRASVGPILSKSQLDQIRIYYLRREFLVPSVAFAPQSLPKFDLDHAEIQAIEAATTILLSQLREGRELYAKQTMEFLSQELTSNATKRLEELVGNRLNQRTIPTTFPAASSLEIGSGSQPFQQLLAAMTVAIPGDHKINKDNFVALRVLLKQAIGQRAKKTLNEKELGKELNSILTNEQRVSLIREMHWKNIVSDVTWLAKPEVLAYIQLDLTDSKNLDNFLQQRQRNIRESVDQAEIKIYKAALNALSDSKRSEMERLLDGVFALKLD